MRVVLVHVSACAACNCCSVSVKVEPCAEAPGMFCAEAEAVMLNNPTTNNRFTGEC